MAHLTDLSLQEARLLGREFQLEVTALDKLGGSVNSNFSVNTADGRRWFLRIYEEQDREGALAEAALLSGLAARGVPTAAPIAARGGATSATFQGKPVAVYPWVDGVIRCQVRVTAADTERVGRALGRVHAAGGELSLPKGRFEIANLHARLDRVAREAAPELVAAGEAIRVRLLRAERERDLDLPKGLIHGDLFRDNVLWHDREIAALIDFESASEGTLLFDLLVTLCAWCFADRFVPELVRGLLSGYSAERRLTPREIGAVKTEAAVACLRFATTRITDFSMRAAPGTAPCRDFRRFLARLEAIEAGTLDAELARLQS